MAEFDPPMRYSFREVPPEEELPVNQEIVVAEAKPPAKPDYGWGNVDPKQGLVPGGAATKPPSASPSREPKTYGWHELHPDQSVGTAEKPSSGYMLNIGAGLAEGTTPGVADAIGFPVDTPTNIARGIETDVRSFPHQVKAIGREFGSALGLTTPMTNEEFLQGYKDAEKNTVIPQSPLSNALQDAANKYSGGWIPTPEHPMERVVPATRGEEIARRGAQVFGRVASGIIGSRAFKPFTPYYPGKYEPVINAPGATASTLPTGQLASSLAFAPSKLMGSAPALSSGLVAGGANVGSQEMGDYGVQQGWDENKIRAAQAVTELGGNLVGTIGATAGGVAKDIGRKYVFPNVPHYTDQLVAGLPLGYARTEAIQRLAGQQLEKSPVSPLARDPNTKLKTDWDPSTADVGGTLRGNLQSDVNAAVGGRLTDQIGATRELGKVGGTVADLDTRIANQQASLTPDVEGMRFTPDDVGKRLRASAGSQRQGQGGIVDDILAKDSNGAHVVPHSDVPGLVFNKNLSPENLNDLLWRSKGQFRQAFRDAGMSDFENAAVKRDLSGNKTGELDLPKAQQWVKDHAPLLDAYEQQTEKLWGKPDTSIRDSVASAATKQRALDNLNSQRNLAIAVVPGKSNAAEAAKIWKPGVEGGKAVKEYVASGSPEAVDNLVDLASSSLRTAAEKNGTFDPAAARDWLSKHRDSINQLPPNVRQQFENATRAQELVESRSAARAQAIKDFQTGAAQGYLNGQTPKQAISDILADTTRDPAIGIRELVSRIGNDKPALDALRRDFMEHASDVAVQEASGATGTATSAGRLTNALRAFTNKKASPSDLHKSSLQYMDAMNNFLKNNETSVRALYGDAATDGMKKLLENHPGFGNPHITKGEMYTAGGILLETLATNVAIGPHSLTTGIPGVIKYPILGAIAANQVARKLRAMGISKVNDLFPVAMSNPDLMRTLLQSAKKPGTVQRAMRQLSAITMGEESGGYGMGEDKSKPLKPFKYPPVTAIPGVTGR